ncbi:3-hydroxyacyl-ACP dehydratase FabZ [Athalassotoga saccharophila]|uniref:3-hydroxyacyl-ACP dehydratase FabZ n=1 Tax=Athalassotoga saccharophila TaxID=1441386 RepID=UPI001379F6CE|nr:3-hydroxyacyl-ACP dehydratase FabZ [Athalassotoga saccharophila]BBJ28767.1 3-hydroxyacyl-[acyl-carrier-protein] dehydratase FabZ [Athalassotoga saccharophila]
MDKITDILPHRYPFLMVDGIISKGEKEIVAFKNVSYNEPQFQGHFPDNPIMPGVLILEGMAQAAGLITLVPGKTPLFVGADKVRFRRPVRPGDRLIYEVKIVGEHLGMISAECVAKVDDKICATATLLLGMEK